MDDGRGIDRDKILAKARREGAAPDTDALTDDLLVRVLARPGFSTAQSVSGVSGRGVGVDVAMTRVRALGGTLEVRSELGKGATFCIRVPLTLAIVRALLAEAGGERYAVPLAYVAETVEFDRQCGDRGAGSRGAGGAGSGDSYGTSPATWSRPEPQARSARRPTVILEVGERRSRAGGRCAARTAGYRGRAVRCPPRAALVCRRRDHSGGRRAGADSGRRGAPLGGSMEDVRDLKESQLDAMREVANIGAGHAATALSR